MHMSVPWNAPEAVVDIYSAGVVHLRDLLDAMGPDAMGQRVAS